MNIESNSFRLGSALSGGVKNSLTGITKGFDNKMKDGLDNSGAGFGDSTPEQTINLTTGQKITIADKEYTVIENVQGTQYKVLASDVFYKAFDNNKSNNYASSTIADYLDNDYYNGLDPMVRGAIVEQTIQQKVSSTGYDQDKNSPTWTGEIKDAGTHKVFLPSWEEVAKAAGGTTPTILRTFLSGKYTWLRDTFDSYVLFVGSGGGLGHLTPNNYYDVRHAFVLDLSKVTFTVK